MLISAGKKWLVKNGWMDENSAVITHTPVKTEGQSSAEYFLEKYNNFIKWLDDILPAYPELNAKWKDGKMRAMMLANCNNSFGAQALTFSMIGPLSPYIKANDFGTLDKYWLANTNIDIKGITQEQKDKLMAYLNCFIDCCDALRGVTPKVNREHA